MDIHHFNSGAQSVLAYATVNGSLVGWDLRSNANAWTLRHDLRLGLITSFSVDVHQCWLCLGQENPAPATATPPNMHPSLRLLRACLSL